VKQRAVLKGDRLGSLVMVKNVRPLTAKDKGPSIIAKNFPRRKKRSWRKKHLPQTLYEVFATAYYYIDKNCDFMLLFQSGMADSPVGQ